MKTLKNLILTGIIGAGLSFGFNNSVNILLQDDDSKSKKYSYSLEEDEISRKEWKRLNKYNPLTEKQKDSLLRELNPGLKEFLKNVYLIEEEDMPKDLGGFADSKNFNIYVSRAREFREDERDIILKTIFHEAGHIRHLALDSLGSNFSKKWEEIADFKYKKGNARMVYTDEGRLFTAVWRDGERNIAGGPPKKGILHAEASTDMSEDVATYTEALADKFIRILYYSNIIKADTTDKKYQKKLDLLLEYNFLTSNEHKRLSKGLGSNQYYLLKQN